MVGVPTALHLAAGLLAVAAAAGLSLALLGTRNRAGGRTTAAVLAGGGAAVYALGAVLAGAQLGPVEVRAWLQVAGLLGIAVGGVGRDVLAPAGLGLPGLGLLVPIAPTVPSTAGAVAGTLAAARALQAGRDGGLLAVGLLGLAAGHGVAPLSAIAADVAVVVGALAIGAWLWVVSRRRILAKLLTAFGAALLAMAITLAAVLSTTAGAELTEEELGRLDRLAEQLGREVQSWPAEAVRAAQPLSRAPGTLVGQALDAQGNAELFDLSLSSQDFFLALDPGGQVVNAHPPELGGALRLAVVGDPLVAGLLDGRGEDQAGGLLSTGQVVVGFGAVALRDDADVRPEAPPAGVLVTGRLADEVWAAQQAQALDVGIVGVVGGEPAYTAGGVAVGGAAVADGLGDRGRAVLELTGVDGAGEDDEATRFAAAAPLVDPERGGDLGRVITTSTPQVIAVVEREQARRLFLVTLVGGALALAAAGLVTRRFLRPIRSLTGAAERIGRGELDLRSDVRSPDEVGVLGATFDDMVGSLAAQRRDLTSSAAREARLRGRLESLTTSMGDGLIAVDVDGRVITFNPAAEALTGRAAASALGQPLEEVLVGRMLGDPGAAGDRGFADGGFGDGAAESDEPLVLHAPGDPATVSARLAVARSDGGRVPVAANAAPVRSPAGEIIGRVYVLRDITTDLEVEQMKTQFLANVSHELRTPITPIKGYANVLARRDVGPDATKRFAQQILESTTRLERIVAMIVDFAALDSGRVVLERVPVDLGAIVHESLDGWRAQHEGRAFTADLNGGLPLVLADAGYLRRCIDELVDNAVKFSPDGQPVVVAAHEVGGRVQLQVIDHGIGIEDEATRRLFSDFVQADGTETRHFGGLGLGLGLVKRVLDGIGAEAAVASTPGEGTTISVHLASAGPAPRRVPPPPPPVPPPPG